MGKSKAKRRRDEKVEQQEGDVALKENIQPKSHPPQQEHSINLFEDSQTRKKTQTSTNIPTVSEPPHKITYASNIDLTPFLSHLTDSHEVKTMSVISSTSIEKKVTTALKHLSIYPYNSSTRPVVVILYAQSAVAHKMISVVEIVKREIGKAGWKWYQYTVVNSSLGVRQEKIIVKGKKADEVDVSWDTTIQKNKEHDGEVDMDMSGMDVIEDDEEGFETMKTPFERAIEGRPKVRNMIVIAVYLSRVRIDSLGRIHGEQTNGLQASKSDS